MAKKKTSAKPANEGFLNSAAQAIGATLGQLVKKAGVASSPVAAKAPVKKAPAKKTVGARTKKKAPAKRTK